MKDIMALTNKCIKGFPKDWEATDNNVLYGANYVDLRRPSPYRNKMSDRKARNAHSKQYLLRSTVLSGDAFKFVTHTLNERREPYSNAYDDSNVLNLGYNNSAIISENIKGYFTRISQSLMGSNEANDKAKKGESRGNKLIINHPRWPLVTNSAHALSETGTSQEKSKRDYKLWYQGTKKIDKPNRNTTLEPENTPIDQPSWPDSYNPSGGLNHDNDTNVKSSLYNRSVSSTKPKFIKPSTFITSSKRPYSAPGQCQVDLPTISKPSLSDDAPPKPKPLDGGIVSKPPVPLNIKTQPALEALEAPSKDSYNRNHFRKENITGAVIEASEKGRNFSNTGNESLGNVKEFSKFHEGYHTMKDAPCEQTFDNNDVKQLGCNNVEDTPSPCENNTDGSCMPPPQEAFVQDSQLNSGDKAVLSTDYVQDHKDVRGLHYSKYVDHDGSNIDASAGDAVLKTNTAETHSDKKSMSLPKESHRIYQCWYKQDTPTQSPIDRSPARQPQPVNKRVNGSPTRQTKPATKYGSPTHKPQLANKRVYGSPKYQPQLPSNCSDESPIHQTQPVYKHVDGPPTHQTQPANTCADVSPGHQPQPPSKCIDGSQEPQPASKHADDSKAMSKTNFDKRSLSPSSKQPQRIYKLWFTNKKDTTTATQPGENRPPITLPQPANKHEVGSPIRHPPPAPKCVDGSNSSNQPPPALRTSLRAKFHERKFSDLKTAKFMKPSNFATTPKRPYTARARRQVQTVVGTPKDLVKQPVRLAYSKPTPSSDDKSVASSTLPPDVLEGGVISRPPVPTNIVKTQKPPSLTVPQNLTTSKNGKTFEFAHQNVAVSESSCPNAFKISSLKQPFRQDQIVESLARNTPSQKEISTSIQHTPSPIKHQKPALLIKHQKPSFTKNGPYAISQPRYTDDPLLHTSNLTNFTIRRKNVKRKNITSTTTTTSARTTPVQDDESPRSYASRLLAVLRPSASKETSSPAAVETKPGAVKEKNTPSARVAAADRWRHVCVDDDYNDDDDDDLIFNTMVTSHRSMTSQSCCSRHNMPSEALSSLTMTSSWHNLGSTSSCSVEDFRPFMLDLNSYSSRAEQPSEMSHSSRVLNTAADSLLRCARQLNYYSMTLDE